PSAPACRSSRGLRRTPASPPGFRSAPSPADTGTAGRQTPSRPPSAAGSRPRRDAGSPPAGPPAHPAAAPGLQTGGRPVLHRFPSGRAEPPASVLLSCIPSFLFWVLDIDFAALKAATKFHLDGPETLSLDSARTLAGPGPRFAGRHPRGTKPSSQNASAPRSRIPTKILIIPSASEIAANPSR